MGYDMRWENDDLTEEQVAEKAAAEDWFNATVRARDEATASGLREKGDESDPFQVAVNEAYSRLNRADVSYFRLNLWGMGAAREALWAAGAVHDKMEGQQFNWPDLADFGLDNYPDEWSVEHGDRGPLTDDEKRYLAAHEAVLAAGVEFPGIPLHKLGSNDGWLVTFAECLSAAKAWTENRHKVPDAPGYVDEFMAWVAEAAKHGGFRVH